jgi:hypothetical protein
MVVLWDVYTRKEPSGSEKTVVREISRPFNEKFSRR